MAVQVMNSRMDKVDIPDKRPAADAFPAGVFKISVTDFVKETEDDLKIAFAKCFTA